MRNGEAEEFAKPHVPQQISTIFPVEQGRKGASILDSEVAPGLDSDDDDEEEDVPNGGGIQPGLQTGIHDGHDDPCLFRRSLSIPHQIPYQISYDFSLWKHVQEIQLQFSGRDRLDLRLEP